MRQREHFLDALARLETLHKKSKPVKAQPETLRLSDIRTADAAFQPRRFFGDAKLEQSHVRELARSLSRQGNRVPLESILVIRIGRNAYCVDGHHRLEAYKISGWKGEVPVDWFKGSIRAAAGEAIRRNSYAKLPMHGVEKLEAAWRLVVLDDGMSKAEITRLTTVSNGTIGNMRRELERLREEHAAAAPKIDEFSGEQVKSSFECRLTWAQVKAQSRGDDDWDEAKDDRIVGEWAEKLRKAFGREWGRQPMLAARAIERYSPRLPRRLVEAWAEDELTDEEV